jgi:hypothetical protein
LKETAAPATDLKAKDCFPLGGLGLITSSERVTASIPLPIPPYHLEEPAFVSENPETSNLRYFSRLT